ncbi:hypothetical protein JCM19037_4254 [Geomicrobium sp. JCM 19037]|uniref:hypothetical protein n=1 Tax=unclassified Geomicrobium TaxID=2628951 RepID=UPI00045F3F15|nr:hypothetical protein [Geomicrobium sp. JCM 19037]GAK05727.1 hypothetical protein JCM19037_4254 [Geomicrobium sp. JCM 19037]
MEDQFVWLFAIASLIGSAGVIIAFRMTLRKMEHKLDDAKRHESDALQVLQKEQTNFFIKVPLFEAPAIILLVVGMFFLLNDAGTAVVSAITIPAIIAVASIVASFVFIFISTRQTLQVIDKTHHGAIRTLAFTAIPLANSVPIISIVALILALTGLD